MRTTIFFSLFFAGWLCLLSCKQEPHVISLKFSSAEEVGNWSLSLAELQDTLPSDWSAYNFLVMEMKASSPQRFFLGLETPEGLVSKGIQPFSGAWIRICIPLKYYREFPASAVDMAAMYNKAMGVGYINLNSPELSPLTQVRSIEFRMTRPIGNPTLEIRHISLATESPGDTLLQKGFLVDKFGQWAPEDWPGKAKTIEELQAAWQAEEKELSPLLDDISAYGGRHIFQKEATGFFRTQKVDGKWWFIDPEGYPFLSIGADCIRPSVGTGVKGREYLFEELKPTGNTDFFRWNMERRYGENPAEGWVNTTIKRMHAWGLNTVANWSSNEMMNSGRMPFVVSLRGLRLEKGVMGLPDIYDPQYADSIDLAISQTAKQYKDNPWLLGYFVGNEQPWPGYETILCNRILTGPDRPIKTALQAHIAKEGDSDVSMKAFVLKTFDRFLDIVCSTLKKHDPNHLNIGMRFGGGAPDELVAIAGKHFDVFSFNYYKTAPSRTFIQKVDELTGLPVIIGEYHIGTPLRGMPSGLVEVASEAEVGNAYRYYNEQGYAHPSVIGAHWFQWIDQTNTGRNDGESYHIGLVDVTDRPYPEMVEAMKITHQRLYDVHLGKETPYSVQPIVSYY